MKQIKYFLLVFSSIVIAACGVNNADPVYKLEIPELDKTLIFTEVAKEHFVKVSTNGNAFQAIWIGENWGRIQSDNGGFKVIVDDYTGSENRSAKVDIFLQNSSLRESISVSQSGSATKMTVSTLDIRFNNIGGSSEILLGNVAKNWQFAVVGDNTWLTIKKDSILNKLQLTAAAATSGDSRSAQINITSGTESKTVYVAQSGKVIWFMPNLDFNKMTITNLIAFEKSRGNTFYVPNGGNWRVHNYFNSTSPYIKQLNYVSENTITFNTVEMYVYNWQDLDSPELDAMLKANGFEFVYRDETSNILHSAYWNAEKKIQVALNRSTDLISYGMANIQFSPSQYKPIDPNKQDKAYPTMANYPFVFYKWNSNSSEAKAWDQALGESGVVDYFGALKYEFYPSEGECVYRGYYYDNPEEGMYNVVQVFKNWNKVFYPSIFYNCLTDEFRSLMTKEGFEPPYVDPTSSNGVTFKHIAKNISVNIRRESSPFLKYGLANKDLLFFRTTKIN